MALFSRKKSIKEATALQTDAPTRIDSYAAGVDLAHVLLTPRITEKATSVEAGNVYVFNVLPSATKLSVKEAVRSIYKVTPRMVHMVSIPSKRVRSMRTGVQGSKRGGKKAYVYLKKGETITLT